jgi:FkbH-like protein
MPDEQKTPPVMEKQPVIYLKPTLESPVDALAMRYAYLYLLGREPESEETLDHHLTANGWDKTTIRELRDWIKDLEEYKSLLAKEKPSEESRLRRLEDQATFESANYAYLFILRRDPESIDAVKGQVSFFRTNQKILEDFISSGEYKFKYGGELNVYDAQCRILRENVIENLKLDPPPRRRRVLVYGSCQAGTIESACRDMGWEADLILYPFVDVVPFTFPQEGDYDAVIVASQPREILGRVSQLLGDAGITDFRAGEVAYFRHQTDAIIEKSVEILDGIFFNIRNAIPEWVPVFFTSIVEPPVSSSGILRAQRNNGSYFIIRTLNDHLCKRAERDGNMFYIDLNDIMRICGDAKMYDAYSSWYTHGWLQKPIYDVAVKRIEKCLAVINREVEPIKLIITDLDNTLWHGVLAEDGEVSWNLGYAEALLECKRRGIILAICSKNDYSFIRSKFDQIWYGRIRLEDFVSIRINWRPKSDNIAEILREVNVLPENTLFIDDSPLEIEEVQRAFPQIRTLSGTPLEWRSELLYGAPCQVMQISAESARRTELLQAKIQREREMASNDRGEYLRSLGLRVSIWPVEGAGADFDRALELINKTNQFNTTGQRWSLAEIDRFRAEGGVVWVMRAEDRLADHGLISVALVQGAVLRQMVLSCRVFGLGLEDAFLHHLVSWRNDLRAEFQETERNATAREFIRRNFTRDGELWVLREPPAWPDHLARAEVTATGDA